MVKDQYMSIKHRGLQKKEECDEEEHPLKFTEFEEQEPSTLFQPQRNIKPKTEKEKN